MTSQQIINELQEKKFLQQTDAEKEKATVKETLERLGLMTELFRDDVQDIAVRISERESLEWDSRLRRFVYHRGDTSQFLELARKEIILRIRPFLKDLLKLARG